MAANQSEIHEATPSGMVWGQKTASMSSCISSTIIIIIIIIIESEDIH